MNILKQTKGPVVVQNSTHKELSSLQTCDEMQNICAQFQNKHFRINLRNQFPLCYHNLVDPHNIRPN